MLRKPLTMLLLCSAFAASDAHGRSSNACFTKDEVKRMAQKRDQVSRVAAQCLQEYWDTHTRFYDENRYSKYFGNRNPDLENEDKRGRVLLFTLWPSFGRAFDNIRPEDRSRLRRTKTLSEFEKELQLISPSIHQYYIQNKDQLRLKERVHDERDDLAEQGRSSAFLQPNSKMMLQSISCVDMARRCLGEAFRKAGLGDTWQKIDKEVMANGVSGVEMQKALGDLGWTTVYWNPDTNQNKAWDDEDQVIAPLKPPGPGEKPKVWNGSWGGHAMRWSGGCRADGTLAPGRRAGGVKCTDMYELGGERAIPVDDKTTLVDFGTSVPRAFRNVPFFVGTAHSGYHVFPGFYGKVIEAHSMRQLTSRDNLEVGEFNPLDQENGGSPRWTNSEKYRSGIISVPPGYLKPVPSFDPVESNGCVDLKPVSGK